MMKVYVYSCLLSALGVVEMKPLNINGRVGGNVTFKCSDWNVWSNVKSNAKYLCQSPCKKDEHIIIKAEYGKTTDVNQIQLTNGAEGLFVTFTNLQKSDSKKYYCGVERTFSDPLIEVNLKVTDAESFSPKTTPGTFVVTNGFSTSSSSSDIISDMSTSSIIQSTITTTTASATQAAGSLLFLIIGVVVIITVLMVLLQLMRNMMKKQQKEEEATREDVVYEEITPEELQTMSQQVEVSAIYFFEDPDSLYANYSYQQDTELASGSGKKDFSLNSASSSGVRSRGAYTITDPQSDLIYAVAQLPREQPEPTGQPEPSQSESNENDCLYSLAQLPQAT